MGINLKKEVFEEDIIQDIAQEKVQDNFQIFEQSSVNLTKHTRNVVKTQTGSNTIGTVRASSTVMLGKTPTSKIIHINSGVKNNNSNTNLNKVAFKLIHGNTTEKKNTIIKRKLPLECDLSAIFLKDDGKIIGVDGFDSVVYWGKITQFNGGVLLKPNSSRKEDYYDENIYVDTQRIPDNVSSIIFAVNIYYGDHNKQFFKYTNALEFVVFNNDDGTIIDSIEITNRFKGFNGIICCELVKVNGEWLYRYVGKPLSKISTIADIVEQFI